MISILFKFAFAIVLVVFGKALSNMSRNRFVFPNSTMSKLAYLLAVISVLHAVVFSSVIRVKRDQFAVFNRVYAGKSLPPGRRIALDGELGPRAEVFTTGWYFSPLVSVLNEIEYHDILIVPPGKCAVLSAKDGKPSMVAFAPLWSAEEREKMVNDAKYFLTEGNGYKGPQASVLPPGAYTPNPYLWEQPELVEATIVEQGTVGVVKSLVEGDVDFGSYTAKKGDRTLKVLTPEVLPKDGPQAQLVPVGYVGVWEEYLPNGLYFINPKCYQVTKFPVIEMPMEFKGGYVHRIIDLDVDQKGTVTSTTRTEDVPVPPEAADRAILTRVEGFEVPVELRTIVQVTPMMAPYVVATLGVTQLNVSTTQDLLETRIVTPVMRSTLRTVLGGGQLKFETQQIVLGPDGFPKILENGEIETRKTTAIRTPTVLDLVENRQVIEDAVEKAAQEDAKKQGLHINQVRIAETAVPAEMMGARKREILAMQLVKSLTQEELAQKKRQMTEKAKAEAEQQGDLVTAEIATKVAEQKKIARETEAQAEKAMMLAIAEGQKAQVETIGEEQTARLQMFNIVVKEISTLLAQNPQLISDGLRNASKFVPTIYVQGGGNQSSNSGGSNLEAASLLFGTMLNPKALGDIEGIKPPMRAEN